MAELTPAERDLLQRIKDKEELQPFFFRKARGLKWFDSLSESGYFKPDRNPEPIVEREKGFVTVPYWSATEYLVSASTELRKEGNDTYAQRVLEVIRAATKYAIDHEFTNYRTWWQFSRIMRNIPTSLVEVDDVQLIGYWLDDPYERDLVAEEIGWWIVALLDDPNEHSKELAARLLSCIYEVKFHERKHGGSDRTEAILRIRSWYAKDITDRVAGKAGRALGLRAVQVFQNRLESILTALNNDGLSSIWRPAIEDNPQNHQADDVPHVIVQGLREALLGFTDSDPEGARLCVDALLQGRFETVKRIAIHAIDRRYSHLSTLVDGVLTLPHFAANYRHEIWSLLHSHYGQFSEDQKRRVRDIILGMVELDDNNRIIEGASAYRRATWLAAIKDQGEDIRQLYERSIDVAGAEPDHPDFSFYTWAGFVGHESPVSKEDMMGLEIGELVNKLDGYLETYAQPIGFRQPDLEGLAKTLREVVKAQPLRFYPHVHRFSKSGLPYVHEILEAYSELWREKAQLPWPEIWDQLLGFCEDIINQDRFWSPEMSKRQTGFVANREWIVTAIGRLIENGTRSDDHAFDKKYLGRAESVLRILLAREKGAEFTPDGDAVLVAMNSPRGSCIEALINLTLRSCRLADRERGGHTDVWARYQGTYDAEMARSKLGEYEFSTLAVHYLPNLLYISKEWVFANLGNLFDQNDYQKWLCAMKGYAYVSAVYPEIFGYLRDAGHFVRALDDANLKERVAEKIVQNIVIAFLHDFEDLDDENSLIHKLLVRRKDSEISHLIWFVSTLLNDADQKTRDKVLRLWRMLLKAEPTSPEDRLIASRLCGWIGFVDDVNDTNRPLIMLVAPFADETHASYGLLKDIARISERQPSEAYQIWRRLLERSRADHPTEAIRTALGNLLRGGHQGTRDARDIVSQYLRNGNEQPSVLLHDMLNGGTVE
jgi:hypothetical protein